jgi:hypothetical protein
MASPIFYVILKVRRHQRNGKDSLRRNLKHVPVADAHLERLQFWLQSTHSRYGPRRSARDPGLR